MYQSEIMMPTLSQPRVMLELLQLRVQACELETTMPIIYQPSVSCDIRQL